jgi:hypothetical protein
MARARSGAGLRRPDGRGQRCWPQQQEGRCRPGALSAEASGEQFVGTLATQLFRCHHADKSRDGVFRLQPLSRLSRALQVVDKGTVGELVCLEALARSLGRKLGSLGIIKSNSEVRHKPSIGVGDGPGSGVHHAKS